MNDETNPLVRSGENHWPEPGPAWWQQLRRLYDALAVQLARTHLSGTIAAFDAAGRAANRLRLLGPRPGEVAALYDWLSPQRVGAVTRDIAAQRLKNHAAMALVKSAGTSHLANLVRWQPNAARGEIVGGNGGRVIVACHVGAFFGIRAALHSVNQPALTLRDLPLDDQASRMAALKRAIDHLREGGLVVATLDGPGGTSTREVDCVGRRIVFRRGAFVLARLTGAPLIPVVCAWTRRGQIEVRVGSPLERPANVELAALEFEGVMAARAAAWLDEYLRTEPQEIWCSTLRHYLAAPPSQASRRPEM